MKSGCHDLRPDAVAVGDSDRNSCRHNDEVTFLLYCLEASNICQAALVRQESQEPQRGFLPNRPHRLRFLQKLELETQPEAYLPPSVPCSRASMVTRLSVTVKATTFG